MTIDHIILDNDGTLTDTFLWMEQYIEKYTKEFAKGIGASFNDLFPFFEEARQILTQDKNKALIVNNHAVARVNSDPQILVRAIYEDILRGLKSGGITNLNYNPEKLLAIKDRQRFFLDIYNSIYLDVTHFRKGTKEFLDNLVNKHPVVIVTNTDKKLVHQKMEEEIGNYQDKIEIIGGIRKSYIEPSFQEVPESIPLEGFPRPVCIRKPYYKKLLDKLKNQGFTPETTVVVGNIYEVDLALPEFLNYFVMLMNNPGVAEYEKQHLERSDRGFLVRDYNQILSKIEDLRL